MTRFTRLLPLLLLLLLPAIGTPAELHGRVVRVVDGDTLIVLDASNEQHRIRLAGIDTPEKRQPFARKAKEHLINLVAGKQVTVDWHKRDRYRRIVGKILHADADTNLAMVAEGLAWWYRKYANEQTEVDRVLYEAAEMRAREERRGLWADPSPAQPWEWRRRKRVAK